MGAMRLRVMSSLFGSIGARGPLDREITVAGDEPFEYEVDIPTGTTEQALPIITANGGIETVNALVIASNKDISVTLGAAASNAPIPIHAGGFLALGPTTLTAIALSNSSGDTAHVLIRVI